MMVAGKADTIEDIIETISGPGNFYEGRIKRIIEVTERDGLYIKW